MTERDQHTFAHRVSLAVSVVVLAALAVALMTGLGRDEPAQPVAEIAEVLVGSDGSRHVLVDVTNQGDLAAAGVQVSASLTIGGEEQTGDQTIDFLGAGEQQTVVFVFDTDPATGDLQVAVTSYAVP